MPERMKDITPPHLQPGFAQPPAPAGPQAAALSKTLRQMAAKARGRRRFWTPNSVPARRWEQSFGTYILRGFIAIVVAPVLAAGLYLALFMTDQYDSEMRFAVRGAERATFDPLSSLLGVPSSNRVQEALIISDYIRGRGIVEELEKTLTLRQRFSGRGIDPVSRFNPDNPIEDLVKYWRWHVSVDVDSLSGIVTVKVFAFTPRDAREIAQAILAASERLVNDLSDRSRRDALAQTQEELTRAEAGLHASIRAMQDLRNAEGLLDATKQSEAMTEMLAAMRLELIRMDGEYNAQRQTLAANSPQLRVLEARIRAAREQIGKLEGQMTGGSRKEAPVLADSMSRFERMKLDHDIAQKRYIAAAAAFEKARIDVKTQQVYLTTFLSPTLAEESLYPRRLWMFTIFAAICLAVWGLGTGAATLVRNHMG